MHDLKWREYNLPWNENIWEVWNHPHDLVFLTMRIFSNVPSLELAIEIMILIFMNSLILTLEFQMNNIV